MTSSRRASALVVLAHPDDEIFDAFRPVFEREVFVLGGTRIPSRSGP